jgi:hypothetical protein
MAGKWPVNLHIRGKVKNWPQAAGFISALMFGLVAKLADAQG